MLEFHKMTEEEKSAACSWRYAGEYALYNMPPYEEDLRARSGFASLDFVGFGSSASPPSMRRRTRSCSASASRRNAAGRGTDVR